MPHVLHRPSIKAPPEQVREIAATGRAAAARPPRKRRQACARRAAAPRLPGQRARGPATEPAVVMEVTSLEPERRVGWRCVRGPEDWVGTNFSFRLEPTPEETVLLFTNADWREPVEFMHHCSTKWGYHLLGLKAGLEANAAAVAAVCVRLDGIPLALELAAARLGSLSVSEVSARLDQRFGLLTGGSRTALPRHQTLRALIDWSYDLLNPGERLVLDRLSVFAWGWTLEAAEAVAVGGDAEEWLVLDHLAALVGRSLVQAEDTDGSTRYRLLETVRQYAAERLALRACAELDQTRATHRDHYLALVETAETRLRGPHEALWLDRLEVEFDNIRAALAFSAADPASAEPGLRLAAIGRAVVLDAQAEPAGRADRLGLARPATGQHGQQTTRLVAVPDRDGERPARLAHCCAQYTDMHAGQELLALGSTHENPHDRFIPDRRRSVIRLGAAAGTPNRPLRPRVQGDDLRPVGVADVVVADAEHVVLDPGGDQGDRNPARPAARSMTGT
jgi:hypothetical protein